VSELTTKVTDYLLDCVFDDKHPNPRAPQRLASMVAATVAFGTKFPVYEDERELVQETMQELGTNPVIFVNVGFGQSTMTLNPDFKGDDA